MRDPKFHDRVVAETRALVVDDSKTNGRAWTPLGLVLRSQVKGSDPLLLPDDGQPGSYEPVRRISTAKRACVYRLTFTCLVSRLSWSMVIEEMTGGQHQVDERKGLSNVG